MEGITKTPLAIKKIKRWKKFVVAVVWNNPPNIPTPFAKNKRYKLS